MTHLGPLHYAAYHGRAPSFRERWEAPCEGRGLWSSGATNLNRCVDLTRLLVGSLANLEASPRGASRLQPGAQPLLLDFTICFTIYLLLSRQAAR